MHISFRTFAPLLVVLHVAACGCRGTNAKSVAGDTITTRNGAAVSVSRDASAVGRDVMLRGGNAVDAAVATAFALAVTFPEAGNIGGGGFMLIRKPNGEAMFIDYREMAPAASTVDMFARGRPSQHLLVGVPGTVRGLELAHQKFGKRPWKEMVEPAIELAEKGFVLNDDNAGSLSRATTRPGSESDELRRVLSKPGGGRWQAGDRVVQPELAATLRRIADQGSDGFYKGVVAEALAATVKEGGGIITTDDLANYIAKIRTPLRGTFRDHEIIAAPPPSSGGTALIEMLNMLEAVDLRQSDRWSPRTLHYMVETMKRGFVDRARHLGDPDFVQIASHLTDKQYAVALTKLIEPDRALPSTQMTSDFKIADEGEQTTHFSVLDPDGMAVSNTYTLEHGYGSRVMVKGMGFLLNNEMGDFNPRPGVTDRTGRIGTKPNLVAPGKRMLSSMTPIIVTKNGKVVMISGSPGGRTIINTMLCVCVNRLEYGMSPRETIDAPRMSHTWLPDSLSVERALVNDHAESIEALKKMGHPIGATPRKQGDAHTIFIDEDGTIHGIADHRRSGAAAGF
jgi:gamma-glutamyltranspeptidase/glutathione hydrolase